MTGAAAICHSVSLAMQLATDAPTLSYRNLLTVSTHSLFQLLTELHGVFY